jgi:hypothetical protein
VYNIQSGNIPILKKEHNSARRSNMDMDKVVFMEFHFSAVSKVGKQFFVGTDLTAILDATKGGTEYGDRRFYAWKKIRREDANAGSPFGLSTIEELIRLMEKRDVPYASLGSIQ